MNSYVLQTMPPSYRKDQHRINRIYFAGFLLVLFSFSCMPEDEVVNNRRGIRLSFSTDTIFFDTLFTDTRSTTQVLRVFNTNANAVNVSLQVGRGERSPYLLKVNGREGKTIEGIRVFGEDSLFVFLEATIPSNPIDSIFEVKDSLIVTVNENQQDVKLLSWAENPVRFQQALITTDSIFTAARPYFIRDSLEVAEGASLQIEAGSRLFFAQDALLRVRGQLVVQGTAEQPVFFLNERSDPPFNNTPGLWEGIILENSTAHQLNHAVIRNASTGVFISRVDSDSIADLTINNSIIENMSAIGLLSLSADVRATNTLIDNCAQRLVFAGERGTLRFTHCTFANATNDFFREEPSVVFTDQVFVNENPFLSEALNVTMENSILWGTEEEELAFAIGNNAQSVLSLQNNLIRSGLQEGGGSIQLLDNIFNEDPEFVNPFNFNYRLDSLSPAVDSARPLGIPTDLRDSLRDESPDIGAFEFN